MLPNEYKEQQGKCKRIETDNKAKKNKIYKEILEGENKKR